MDREGCWGDFCTRKLLGMFCPNCDVPTEFMHARKFKDTMTLVKGMYQDSDKGYFAGAFVGKQFKAQKRDFDQSLENMLEDLSTSTTQAIETPDVLDNITVSSDQSDFNGSVTSLTSFNGNSHSKRVPGYSIDIYLKGNKRGSCPSELNLAGCDLTTNEVISNTGMKNIESKPRKSYVEYDHALDDLLEDLNASVSSLEKLCEEVKVETMEDELEQLKVASEELERQMFHAQSTEAAKPLKSVDNCVLTTKVNPSPTLQPKFRHNNAETKCEDQKKKPKSKSLISLLKPKARQAKADFSTSEDDNEKVQPTKKIKNRKMKKAKKEDVTKEAFDSKPITRVTSEPSIAKTSHDFKLGCHPQSAFEPVSFIAKRQVETQDSLIKIPKPIHPKRSLSSDSRLRDLNVIMGLEDIPDQELDDIPSSAFRMQQTSKPRMGVKLGSELHDKHRVISHQSNPVINIQKPEIPPQITNGKSLFSQQPPSIPYHCDNSATTSPMDTSSISSSPCPTCGHLKSPEYFAVGSPWSPTTKSASAPNTRPVSPNRKNILSSMNVSRCLPRYQNGHHDIVEEQHDLEGSNGKSLPGMLQILSKDNLDITVAADDNITIMGGGENKDTSKGDKKNIGLPKDIEIWLGKPGLSPCVKVSSSGKSIHIQNYKDDGNASNPKNKDPNRRKTVSSCYEAVDVMKENGLEDQSEEEINAPLDRRPRRSRSQRRHTYSSTLDVRTGTPDKINLQSSDNISEYEDSGADKVTSPLCAELELQRSRSLIEHVRKASKHISADNSDSSESDRGLNKCAWNGSLPVLNSYTDLGPLNHKAQNRYQANGKVFAPINFTPINKNYTSTFTISNTAFYRPLAGRRSRDSGSQKENRSRSIYHNDRKKVTNEEFISKLNNVEQDETLPQKAIRCKARFITRDNKLFVPSIKQRPSKPFEANHHSERKPNLQKYASAETLTSHDYKRTNHDKSFITLPQRQSSDIKIPIPKFQRRTHKTGHHAASSASINVDQQTRLVKKEKSIKQLTDGDSSTSEQPTDTCPWRSIPRVVRNARASRSKPTNQKMVLCHAVKEACDTENTPMGHQEENNNCENVVKCLSPRPNTHCEPACHSILASNPRYKSGIEVRGSVKTDPNLANTGIEKATGVLEVTKPRRSTEKLHTKTQVKTHKSCSDVKQRNGPSAEAKHGALGEEAVTVGNEGLGHLPTAVPPSMQAKQTEESVNIKSSPSLCAARGDDQCMKTRRMTKIIPRKCTDHDASEGRNESRMDAMKIAGEATSCERPMESAIHAVRAITKKIESTVDKQSPSNKYNQSYLPNEAFPRSSVGENEASKTLNDIDMSPHTQSQEYHRDMEGGSLNKPKNATCQNVSANLQNNEISEVIGQEVVSLFRYTPEIRESSDFMCDDKRGKQSDYVHSDHEISTETNQNTQNSMGAKSQLTVNLASLDRCENVRTKSLNSHLETTIERDKCGTTQSITTDTNIPSECNEEKSPSPGGLIKSNDDVVMSVAKNIHDENYLTSASCNSCQTNAAIISPTDTTNQDRLNRRASSPSHISNITGTDRNTADCDSVASAKLHKDDVIIQHTSQSIKPDQMVPASATHITKQINVDIQTIASHDDRPNHQAVAREGSNIMAINSSNQDKALSVAATLASTSLLSIRHRENSPADSSKSYFSISAQNTAGSHVKSVSTTENKQGCHETEMLASNETCTKSGSELLTNKMCTTSSTGRIELTSHCPPAEKQSLTIQSNLATSSHPNVLNCNLIGYMQSADHPVGIELQQKGPWAADAAADAYENGNTQAGLTNNQHIQKQTMSDSQAAICKAGKINQHWQNDTHSPDHGKENSLLASNDHHQEECANNSYSNSINVGVKTVSSSTSPLLASDRQLASGMQENVLMNSQSRIEFINGERYGKLSDAKKHQSDNMQVDTCVNTNNLSGRLQNDTLSENISVKSGKRGNLVTDNNCQMSAGSPEAVICKKNSFSVEQEMNVDRNITSTVTSAAMLDLTVNPRIETANSGGRCNEESAGGSISSIEVVIDIRADKNKTTGSLISTNVMSTNSMLCNTELPSLSKYTEPMEHRLMGDLTGSKDRVILLDKKVESECFMDGKDAKNSVGDHVNEKPPLPALNNPSNRQENDTIQTMPVSKQSGSSTTDTVKQSERTINVTHVKPPIHASRTQFRRYGTRTTRPRSLDSGMDLAQLEIELMRRLMSERENILYGGSLSKNNKDLSPVLPTLDMLVDINRDKASKPTCPGSHCSEDTSCKEMSYSPAPGYKAIDQSQSQQVSTYTGSIMSNKYQSVKGMMSRNAAMARIGEQSKQILEQTLKMKLYKGPIFGDQETQEHFRQERGRSKKISIKKRPKSASGSFASGRSQSTNSLYQGHTSHDLSSLNVNGSQYPWHSNKSNQLSRSRSFDVGPKVPIKSCESPPLGRYRRRPSPSGCHRTSQRDFDEEISAKRQDARRKKNEVPDPDIDVDFEELEHIFEQQLAELQACPVEDCLRKSANNSRSASMSPHSNLRHPSPLLFSDKPPTPVRSLVKAANLPGNLEGASNNSPCNSGQYHEALVDREARSMKQTKQKLEQMFQQQLGLKLVKASSCKVTDNENGDRMVPNNQNGKKRSNNGSSGVKANENVNNLAGGIDIIDSVGRSRLMNLESVLSRKMAKGPTGFKEREKCRDSGFHETSSS